MDEHIKSEFRVTGWPGLLPHPAATTAFQYELRYGVFMHDAHEAMEEMRGKRPQRWIGRPSERFDEVYLQLMQLDLYDEAAVLRWVNEFGVLPVHDKSRLWPRPIPAGPYSRLIQYPGFGGDFQEELIDESERARNEAGFEPKHPRDLYPVTLEELRWGAGCICDMARSYWCLSTRADPASLQWDNPAIDEWLGESSGSARLWDERDMSSFLIHSLSAGLDDFHPTLIPEATAQLRGRSRAAALAHFAGEEADLYSICCLELFNHIVEGAIYKTCMNETCGRWFVRQQGRSAHDQRRRSGVRFCSYTCARQQTQRSHRRRRRQPDT